MAYTMCEFLETPPFTRQIRELLTDEEYRTLQLALGLRPERDNLTDSQVRILSRLVKEEFR